MKGPTPNTDVCSQAVKRELRTLVRRARSYTSTLAHEVHPELDGAAYSLLLTLADYGVASSTELAGFYGIDKAAISRQVRILAELGLVCREPNPADARVQLLRLSPQGADAVHRADCSADLFLRDWSEADLETFAGLLERFNASRLP